MAVNKLRWLLPVFCHVLVCVYAAWPYEEYYHDSKLTPPPEGAAPIPVDTPDFRIEEATWYRHYYAENSYIHYIEVHRPFRLSPSEYQIYRWDLYKPKDNPRKLACYCTTVYRKLTVLAGCAVLTRRHILTTASSTELILQNYRKYKNLEGILGAWYDHDDHKSLNSSMYMTPARIHYHPRYLRIHQTNHSHPLPFVYDLAIWTSTQLFYSAIMFKSHWRAAGYIFPIIYRSYWPQAVTCQRGAPHKWEIIPSTPKGWDLLIIVGFQFMKAFRRRILPWFKYAIKTRRHTVPCPKIGWGWYHCVPAQMWSKYGLDSGAALHRSMEGTSWVYDGLIGLNAFTMNLRSVEITNYFTVLNTYPVLDFIYDSYKNFIRCEYIDERFVDHVGGPPYLKPGRDINKYLYNNYMGQELWKRHHKIPIY